MKQETQETTIADYHNMHKRPVKKYHAIQIRDTVTGRKKWVVVWFMNNGTMRYQFPTSYGMRSAVRLANRLQKEHEVRREE